MDNVEGKKKARKTGCRENSTEVKKTMEGKSKGTAGRGRDGRRKERGKV